MWWAEAGLLTWAGLCCLARANHRYRAVPLAGVILVRAGPALIMGWALFAAGLAIAVAALGPAQGVVGFTCLAGVVGTGFVLLLSVRPRMALAISVLLPGSSTRHRRITK